MSNAVALVGNFNCTNLSRPLGLLVWKAMHDEDFFASPSQPSLSPSPLVVLAEEPETTDEQAAAAVAAMSSDELVALDALVRQRLRIGRLVDEVFADAEALARQRCWAWRACQAGG
jgi:hypothetical protein